MYGELQNQNSISKDIKGYSPDTWNPVEFTDPLIMTYDNKRQAKNIQQTHPIFHRLTHCM